MDLMRSIDNYCERLDPGFWAEPLNAVTNAAFVIGAMIAGLFIGVMEAWAGAFLGGEYKPLVTFSLLVVVLMIRPYGLFGTHEIERL